LLFTPIAVPERRRELGTMRDGPPRITPPQSEMIDANFDLPQPRGSGFDRRITYHKKFGA
jgi:hypothetical protein